MISHTHARKAIGTLFTFATFALAATPFAQTRVGGTYTPSGANYSITAVQGIDASHQYGQSQYSPQVDLNYEMNPSIGVAYDQGDGKLKDFGIGLYTDKSKDVASTGLFIKYDSMVDANTADLVLEDFDLKSGATSFQKNKVEPSLFVFGAGGSLLASANPDDVFGAMTPLSGYKEDTWDLNLGKLLANDHIAAGAVSGVLLYADAKDGEKGDSDPYLLRAVPNAQAVPEPASMSALGLACAGFLARRRKKAAKNA
jgi:hypothetical protein